MGVQAEAIWWARQEPPKRLQSDLCHSTAGWRTVYYAGATQGQTSLP